jgi:hypothetical protein
MTPLLVILFVIDVTKIFLALFSSVLTERVFSFSYELDKYMLQVLNCGVTGIISLNIICFSRVSGYISLVLT